MYKKPHLSFYQQRPIITIVNQAEVAYREFLGSNRVRLEPGLHLNIPILHHIKKVDLREVGLTIQELHGYTKDNVPVKVSGTLFIKVDNVEKACFSVANYYKAVGAVGESAVRSIIGKFEYDTITSERNQINVELRETIGKSIVEWGTSCTRFEIQNMAPANDSVTDQLEAQMRAERAHRENELNTHAKINTAEGEKKAQILKSEADKISVQNKAEAENFAVQQNTKAVIDQIKALKEFMPDLTNQEIVNYLLETKRLENLNGIAQSDNKQVYFLDSNGMVPTQFGKILTDMNTKTD
jgi:regulator of protease activity HflC (stomatin/prohibitin superfamily)